MAELTIAERLRVFHRKLGWVGELGSCAEEAADMFDECARLLQSIVANDGVMSFPDFEDSEKLLARLRGETKGER